MAPLRFPLSFDGSGSLLKLRRTGHDAGLMRFHGLLTFGEHVGVRDGDIALLGGVAAEVEQQWRIVSLRFGLALASLGLEVGFPFAKPAREELVAAIVEVRSRR